MSKPRKPSRGVCGVCHCPVVAPSVDEYHEALDKKGTNGIGELEVNGHLYDTLQCPERLLQVRCPAHGGHGFPPANHGHDTTTQMG